jgi:hypothetical protein
MGGPMPAKPKSWSVGAEREARATGTVARQGVAARAVAEI